MIFEILVRDPEDRMSEYRISKLNVKSREILIQKLCDLSRNFDSTRVITLPPPDEGMRWSDEPVSPQKGNKYFNLRNRDIFIACGEEAYKYFVQIPIEPQKRAYDFSKTGPDVHCRTESAAGFFMFGGPLRSDLNKIKLATHWQAHDGSECPIDGDSCIVEAMVFGCCGQSATKLASEINWIDVFKWRFIRLADNVVWNLSEGQKL